MSTNTSTGTNTNTNTNMEGVIEMTTNTNSKPTLVLKADAWRRVFSAFEDITPTANNVMGIWYCYDNTVDATVNFTASAVPNFDKAAQWTLRYLNKAGVPISKAAVDELTAKASTATADVKAGKAVDRIAISTDDDVNYDNCLIILTRVNKDGVSYRAEVHCLFENVDEVTCKAQQREEARLERELQREKAKAAKASKSVA